MTVEIIGWFGAFCILLGYFLVSTKKVKGDASSYQVINLLGGISLIINAYYNHAWPLVGLNFIWIIIAIKSLFDNLTI